VPDQNPPPPSSFMEPGAHYSGVDPQ
jgi:hypothetical protein